MTIETSAGAVVFYRGAQIEYLLLLSSYWGFPKGHIETGETETVAALREIREETGLAVNLVAGFRVADDYVYQRRGERVPKQAIYFLAQASSRAASLSHEHADLQWFTYDAALAHLDFVDLRDLLTEAHRVVLALDAPRIE